MGDVNGKDTQLTFVPPLILLLREEIKKYNSKKIKINSKNVNHIAGDRVHILIRISRKTQPVVRKDKNDEDLDIEIIAPTSNGSLPRENLTVVNIASFSNNVIPSNVLGEELRVESQTPTSLPSKAIITRS